MERYRTAAVTLSARDLGESDRIIEFFTRDHGRLSAVARGARRSRKRFGGRLEKFVCVDLQAIERAPGTLARIEEVGVIEYFPELTADLERLGMAEVLLELSGRFAVPGAESGGLFDQLLAAWRALQNGALTAPGCYAGILQLLVRQGLLAPFDSCAACGEPAAAPSFSPEDGGLLCRSCRPKAEPISEATADALRSLGAQNDPEEWGRGFEGGAAAELRALAKTALEWQGGGPLRALRVWEESLLNR